MTMMSAQPTRRRLSEIVDDLIDPCVGILHDVEEAPRQAGDPDFFYFSSRLCDAGVLSGRPFFTDAIGGGASARREIALAKAIGEAVERYCPAFYDLEDCPPASVESATFPCVNPDEFALYSPAQYAEPAFPYAPFGASPLRWTPMTDLTTGEVCYAPAALVFVPYIHDEEMGEKAFAPQISTGLAAHTIPAQAAVSAICEIIERDAFTITWQAMLARPQVRIETLSERNRDLVRRFNRPGSSVTLLDLRMDHGVPAILAVLRSEAADLPALAFAAAAHLDPEEAIRKSLEELALACRLARGIRAELSAFVPDPDWGNVVSLKHHASVYYRHENLGLADFLFQSRRRIAFDEIENFSSGDPARELETLVQKVAALGHRILLADLTTEDVRRLGLCVVRAVIPGFHPLFMGHRFRALGGRRLWEVPQRLGYKGITRETGDNPAPHPFP
jgi:ribosomal protein S12 methylthiotransferase accessory factor